MTEPLVVVSWKWKQVLTNPRINFTADHVNTLRRMVERNYPHPHKFVCITDDPAGIDPEVTVIPLWSDYANLSNPGGPHKPSCYRRLKLFSKGIESLVGRRFVSLDLDAVVVGDLSSLWNRPDDFVIWGDTAKGTPYNGSMFLLTAGTRSKVWDDFDPVESPQMGRRLRYIGSDQAWIGASLGPNEPKWTAADGVYSYRNELLLKGNRLPANAKIVFFHGRHKPWHSEIHGGIEWVRKNWV